MKADVCARPRRISDDTCVINATVEQTSDDETFHIFTFLRLNERKPCRCLAPLKPNTGAHSSPCNTWANHTAVAMEYAGEATDWLRPRGRAVQSPSEAGIVGSRALSHLPSGEEERSAGSP